jgi:hypothetical protein
MYLYDKGLFCLLSSTKIKKDKHIVSGWYGTELIACICGSEASNPFLQLRWFLRETGKYDTILGEIVDIIFMLLFGGLRIVNSVPYQPDTIHTEKPIMLKT